MLKSRSDQLKDEVTRITEKHKEITIEKDIKQRILAQKESQLKLLQSGKPKDRANDVGK